MRNRSRLLNGRGWKKGHRCLAGWLRAAGLQLDDVSGLAYDPLRQRAHLSRRTGVNYLACATRPGA